MLRQIIVIIQKSKGTLSSGLTMKGNIEDGYLNMIATLYDCQLKVSGTNCQIHYRNIESDEIELTFRLDMRRWRHRNNCLHQGSVLAPLLFTVYTNTNQILYEINIYSFNV